MARIVASAACAVLSRAVDPACRAAAPASRAAASPDVPTTSLGLSIPRNRSMSQPRKNTPAATTITASTTSLNKPLIMSSPSVSELPTSDAVCVPRRYTLIYAEERDDRCASRREFEEVVPPSGRLTGRGAAGAHLLGSARTHLRPAGT